jgi:hypothetical protein
VKILFVMRNSGYTRNWEWVIRVLAERGHRVHIGFELERPQVEVAERLACEFPGVTFGYVPLRLDFWQPLLHAIGKTIDYLRYLEPMFREATKLRARARRALSPPTAVLLSSWPLRTAACRRILDRTLRACERAIPTAREIDRYIREADDVVMATPLVGGECQHDYLRSARQLGRMVVYPVNSWDNLTSKGLVHLVPDRMYVWNEVQHREAVELHGIPSERIAVVGAHSFDHWFDWQPSTSREEFARKVGVSSEQPILLYVCSSTFIARDERPIVRRWAEALRASDDPLLREASILVRPHPSNRFWHKNPLAGLEKTVVWPLGGMEPRSTEARSDYYDSLYHSAAVIGVNTSALIEAAIVGRRTYTFLLPELRETQEGTLHFHYLLCEHGGPLRVADGFDEHLSQLSEGLRNPEPSGWNLGFLRSFVRPQGLDEPCAPLVVDDLEREFTEFMPAADRSSALLRTILYPLAAAAHLSPRTRRHRARHRRARQEPAGRVAIEDA